MGEFFLKIINMSISASWIVLVVLVLRLLLKRAPKWVHVLLWGIVAVRLVCPFSLESALSLIPSAETVSPEIMMDRTPQIDSGVSVINDVVNPIISSSFTPQPMASANPLQILIPVAANLWLLGVLILLAYTAISYWRIRRKVRTAVHWQENIFQSEQVVSPFVLGILRPRIYLPFAMSEQEMDHVIAHEKAHIRRKDHWWKPLGFLVLTVYWFNPLLWLGYVLLCRDIELACDEKVVKDFTREQKADYSQALLRCSVNHRMISACPLAFGEVGVKRRVKSVLNYKKPAFWLIVAAVVASIVVAVCFLTDPLHDSDPANQDAPISVSDIGGADGPENVVINPAGVQMPTLTVAGPAGTVEAGKGTSSWMYQNEDGTESAVMADSQHPLSLVETMPVLEMLPDYFSHTDPNTVTLWFYSSGNELPPDKIEVLCWSEKCPTDDPERIEVITDNGEIAISLKDGNYIYELTAVWNSSSQHGGTVRYHFRTETLDLSQINYPQNTIFVDVTPEDQLEKYIEEEETVYYKPHYQYLDLWRAGGYTYKYRLEITGRMHNAAKNTTYIVLSNTKDITFDMAWKAAGYSSNSEDYFDPEVAMIVGSRLFS